MASRHYVQIGERYTRGQVIAIESSQRTLRTGRVKYFRVCTLRCDCGTVYKTAAGQLTGGHTRSCGCLQREWAAVHMKQISQGVNAARVQVGAEHPSSATHREARKIKRFDPADPDYKARWSLWLRFHITLEEYAAKLAAQGGRCAICRKLPGKTKLHVDHDHRCCPGRTGCGKCNRDLLCFTCNGLVGALEKLGTALLSYVTKWGVPYASSPDSGLFTCGNMVLEWNASVYELLQCSYVRR
jgi:hypothetical protein